MNEMINFSFSELAFLRALILGICLFLGLKLVHRGLQFFSHLRGYRALLYRSLPVIEASLWLFYAVWAVGAIFKEGLYYNTALMMILAIAVSLVSWFAIRDWIAGIVLKIQDAYEDGQEISIRNIQGTIRRVGHLALEIELPEGEQIKIPYSQISGQIRGRSRPDTTSNHHRFEIEIKREIPLSEAQEQLRNAILNSPWSAFDREPQIKLLNETAAHYLFEAIVYAPGVGCGQAIEEDVKEQFKDSLSS